MNVNVYYMSEEDITDAYSPDASWGSAENGTLEHPYFDSEGAAMPGWYWDCGQPGCIPDGTSGPFDSPADAWNDATNEGALVWPSFHSDWAGGQRRTRHLLVIPDDRDERIPYFVRLNDVDIEGLGILYDWGYSFVQNVDFGTVPARIGAALGLGFCGDLGPYVEESTLRDISQHGCASGCFMPAVEYAKAEQILQYVERLDDYFNDCGIEHSWIVATEREGGTDSLQGLACRIASLLVESLASSLDLEADCARHRLEDRP